jgi:Zn finger protein HypA/HybF involved in hydrogenase expression
MTVETKYLIELSDILGVEFKCHNCGAKTSPELESNRLVLLSCPLCNADWLSLHTEEEKTLRTFLNVIKSAKSKMDGRGFSLRLHIKSPDESVSQ